MTNLSINEQNAHNVSSEHLLEQSSEHHETVLAIIVLTQVTLGVLGNVASACVMNRREFKESSTAVYLIMLSLFDTLSLLVGPLNYAVLASKQFGGILLDDQSVFSCLVMKYLVYLFPHVSSWCLCAVTIERVLVVYWPHR